MFERAWGHWIRGILLCAGAGSASGCATEPIWANDTAGSVHLISEWRSTVPSKPGLWIIVVDDAPTEEGRALRAQVAAELDGWIDRWRTKTCVGAGDPGRFLPWELRVLVIPSSDPKLARHGKTNPELELITDNASSTAHHDWELALADAILNVGNSQLDLPADSQIAPNKIFDAINHWDGVLNGRLKAERTVDQEFVASLSPGTTMSLFIATTRDESRLKEPFGQPALQRALLRNEDVCSGQLPEQNAPLLAGMLRGQINTCEDSLFDDGLTCDLGISCNSGIIARSELGQETCRVLAYADTFEPCPNEVGWHNPLDEHGQRPGLFAPEPSESSTGLRRVCEVRQLEGAALESCKNDLACEDCEPGWCFRAPFAEASWDYAAHDCTELGLWDWSQIRFVHGADSGLNANFSIICQME